MWSIETIRAMNAPKPDPASRIRALMHEVLSDKVMTPEHKVREVHKLLRQLDEV